MSTASTTGARDHARSQAAEATREAAELPAGIDVADITWTDVVPADGYATKVLGRGTRLRLTDRDGDACAHLLMLRSDAPWERLNVADTVKVLWQAYLGPGHALLSDQGRVLATIVTDTGEHHDTLCGTTPAGRDLLVRAGFKQGLTIRDIAPTVSFFRGVRVDEAGALNPTGGAGPGNYVELIVHLPLTVLIVNAPHPLDSRPTTPLEVVAWHGNDDLGLPVSPDPEYVRALENTESAWWAAQNGGIQ